MISFESDDGTTLDADLDAFKEALSKPQLADEAPYGYKTDPATGEQVPKKAAGRPRKSPTIDELKASKDDDGHLAPSSTEDTAPAKTKKGKARIEEPPPPYQPGFIAKHVNALYRRVGKIINGFDPVVGAGIIDAATKDDEDKITVGDAWDELARTNPRIRRFLMKMLTLKGYGALFWSHLPIFIAVYMTVNMRMNDRHPNQLNPTSFMDKLGTSAAGIIPDLPGGNPLAGLKDEDMAQMMDMAKAFMPQMMQMTGTGASQ